MDKLAPPEVGGASYLNNNAIVRLVGALPSEQKVSAILTIVSKDHHLDEGN